tara:strand:- start:86 stop:274 length:189 start_codon:yes stop_codon:yes gene_type:complete
VLSKNLSVQSTTASTTISNIHDVKDQKQKKTSEEVLSGCELRKELSTELSKPGNSFHYSLAF